MFVVHTLIKRLDGFLDRVPWLLPLIGFAAGWLSFVLVQRGYELARLIALTVLAGWLWLFIQPWLMKWFRRHLSMPTVRLMSNFVSQSLQQEILFFSLPFLMLSTRESSPGQVLFTLMVAAAALLSTLDPLYEKYIASDRISSLAFHSVCTFVAGLVILPVVVKIPVEKAFYVSLAFVTLGLMMALPGLYRRSRLKERRIGILLAVVSIPVVLLFFRQNIPPAGIEVTRAMITSLVSDHEPAGEVKTLTPEQVRQGVYAFAAIRAPGGLVQKVIFEWHHGEYLERIESGITGGREDGYRTYAVKKNFGPDMLGDWSVDILTPQGQLLESLRFTIAEQVENRFSVTGLQPSESGDAL